MGLARGTRGRRARAGLCVARTDKLRIVGWIDDAGRQYERASAYRWELEPCLAGLFTLGVSFITVPLVKSVQYALVSSTTMFSMPPCPDAKVTGAPASPPSG
jgi:hypothetical protein